MTGLPNSASSSRDTVETRDENIPTEYTSFNIEVVRDFERLNSLKEQWNRTLRNSSANVVFLTHEWLSIWIRNHPDAANDLRIIVARNGSEVVGFIPLMVSRREGFRRLGSIGVESLDYEDIVVEHSTDTRSVLNAMVDTVIAEDGWDYWQFNRIGRSPEVITHLMDTLRKTHYRWVMVESEFSSVVPIIGTWDEYWSVLSKRFRKNFRRYKNRLADSYRSVEIGYARSDSEIAEGMEHLFRFHRARRKEIDGNDGLFASDVQRQYYTNLASELKRVDWLHMPTMRVDDRLVGVQLNIEYADTVYKALPGFDPEFADYAIGMQLNVDVMKKAFDKKLSHVDFLRGAEGYKSDFRPERIQLYSLTVFNNTVRGRLARAWLQQARPLIRDYFDIRRPKKILGR